MDLGIAGKVAFVSGGSKGMGRSAAEILAAEGCKVAVVARAQGSIDEVVSEIRDQDGTALGVSADMATGDGIKAAVAAVTAEFGSPDIVVSLTNDFNFAYFDDSTEEQFEEVFRSLTLSHVRLARATMTEMRRKKWRRFIHIGSIVAKEAQFNHPHIYHDTVRPSTSAFLRSLAQEVAARWRYGQCARPGLDQDPIVRKLHRHQYGFHAGRGRSLARRRTRLPAYRWEEASRYSDEACGPDGGDGRSRGFSGVAVRWIYNRGMDRRRWRTPRLHLLMSSAGIGRGRRVFARTPVTKRCATIPRCFARLLQSHRLAA